MSKVEDSAATEPQRVRNRWDYVRKKLKRRGVVEVNKSHPHHCMLDAIKEAIRKLLTEHPEAKAKEELLSEDFNHKIKFKVTSKSGKSYGFTSYASPVFSCIRSAVNIKEDDYLESLSPEDLPYLEFISNSRSGQDFYFSNNQRFILKTDKHHCVQYFLSILRDYLEHFQTYPHSLLVKFLGLYSIKMSRSNKKYFLVMQSIFYPTVRLEERFDIKGCLANRYQNPHPSGKKTIIVLKDQNFLEEKLNLGRERAWFLTQLKADIDFLLEIGVQDYSLLLGRHPITHHEKRESVGNLVLRMKKSFGHDPSNLPVVDDHDPDEDHDDEAAKNHNQNDIYPKDHDQNDITSASNIKADGTPLHQTSNKVDTSLTKSPKKTVKAADDNIEMQSRSPKKDLKPTEKSPLKSNSVHPVTRQKITFLRSLSDMAYLDSTGIQFQNRRLLLNHENSLHIIDGENIRYYIGVIDFFTQFQCRQRIAKFFKDIKTCCGNHSSEPPDVYAERFYEFISERVV